MKILITKLIGAALILGSTQSFATPITYSVTNIPDGSTLILRAWPSQISQPLTYIPSHANTIEATGKVITLDQANWVQVIFDGKVGWIDANYLTQMHRAPLQATNGQVDQVPPEVVNSAEFFSYSADPSPKTQPAVVNTNDKQYTWSKEADSIYDDPTPDNSKKSPETIVVQTPQIHPIHETPTTIAVEPTAPVAQTQTVIIGSIETPIDYQEESISVNRYETIETAATNDFIEN